MDVLVAGGTGFIGTALCQELVDREYSVTAMGRSPERGDLPAAVELTTGDVTSYDSIEGPVAEHDAVVNLVSLSPLFQTPPGSHDRVHRGGTENLLRAAESAGTDRFIQISGLDADPAGPTDYLQAKGRAERLVRNSSLAWTIVRPSVVFGDGAEFIEFTKLVTTPYVTGLPGGGSMPFQPIWVGDLVSLLAEILEHEAHVEQVYEFGGPAVLTLADVTKLIYAAEGRAVFIVPIPMPIAKLGLSFAGMIPFIPLGPDQARALEIENIVEDNDIDVFGVSEDDLTTFSAYLGV